ncbi:MAG: STAS domain-containing protein [Hahellaceae bacterium]|nr:STAS domain-containing protein [Hahellaceae bacterium]
MSEIQRIKLDSHAVIAQVEALSQQLDDAFLKGTPVVLDASEVQRTDTSVLQLLVAFFTSMRKAGTSATWSSASDDFKDAANLLGVADLIELN